MLAPGSSRARVEAQSYRLTFDERPSVEHLASHIAGVQQKYTQSGGMRPFGVAALILGFDEGGAPRLFQTDPAGASSEWKANAIGKGSKTVREWLEKNYKEEEGEEAVHLAVRALIEVVEPTSKTMEVAVVRAGDAGVEAAILQQRIRQLEMENARQPGGKGRPPCVATLHRPPAWCLARRRSPSSSARQTRRSPPTSLRSPRRCLRTRTLASRGVVSL